MSKLVGLSCLLFLRATYVVSLWLCDSTNYLEVKEGLNNTFVCTGLTAQQTITWLWESFPFSTCTANTCNNDIYPNIFQIRRTEKTSEVTVYASTYSDFDYLATTSLSCQQGNTVTCQLDVVYPAEDSMCQIQFSGDTWNVIGWCNVSKVRSRRNRYECYVYQTSQQSSSTSVGNFKMSTKPISGTNYSFGNCLINIALPPEGKYNYSVIIIPGKVEVFPSFNGSNEIRRPSEPPQHKCPQTVTEGDDVDCVCFSDNLGLPSGYVIWKTTNSPKLKIEKVNRTYDGTSYFCVLMWNNTAVQTVTYTITVNYASRVLSLKIDNKADDVVNVNENRNVSVVCQSEGRPLPKIGLYKMGSDNQNIVLSEANNVQELFYTIYVVNCEAACTYSCQSENSISTDKRYIRLTVECSPKKTTKDSYFTTFVDDEASLTFKMKAYPPPKLLSIFYNGSANNSNSRTVEHENTVMSTCSSESSYSYMITCTVTLLNQTVYAIGFYTITFRNVLGDISFAFEVKERVQTTTNAMKKTADSPALLPGPIVGGVVGGIIFIALTVVIIVFIVRRKRRRFERGLQANPVTSKTDPQRSFETLYDQLQRGDMNSPSVYQTLVPEQTSKDFTDHEDQGKSQVYEVPIDLHENTRGTRQIETIYQNSTFS